MAPQKTDTGRLAYDENGFQFVISSYRRIEYPEMLKLKLWRYDFSDGPSGSGYVSQRLAVAAARAQIFKLTS